MRSPELKEFILLHSNLFWYTPQDKKVEVSDELLVETILNYGDLFDFKELERLLGAKMLADIFLGVKGRKKDNYYPEVFNLFHQYFLKHA